MPTEDELKAAYQRVTRDDAQGLARLLDTHPGLINFDFDGAESWLHLAARCESVNAMKVLLEKGLSVDVQDKHGDTPLSGALIRPALTGARWLLAHGASVRGPGTGALYSAIYSKNPVAVDLVVQSGADVNAQMPTNDLAPVEFARAHGTPEIVQYLLARGATDTLGDSRTEIKKHLATGLGELLRIDEAIGGGIDILLSNEPSRRGLLTVLTVGASDRPLQEANPSRPRYAEFKLNLPADWPIAKDKLLEPENRWPIHWLVRIANYCRSGNLTIPDRFAVMTNQEPSLAVGPGAAFSAFLLAKDPDDFYNFRLTKGEISYYTVFPLFQEEVELERSAGIPHLLSKFQSAGIGTVIARDRVNVGRGSL